MFRQLKPHKSNLDFTQGASQVAYGDVIEYFDAKVSDEVLSIIPERHRQDFNVAIMRINNAVPPHTDSQINTVINFYIKTEPCRTKFFKVKPGATAYQVENQTNGVIFNEADLEFQQAFVASEGDAWCLNVSEVHSVEPIKDISERVAICISTGLHSFDKVCEMLEETGAL
jgi:hypothetical protein